VAKVSMAAASLVYMYSGLIDYANAWSYSYLHRKVVNYCKQQLMEIDVCAQLHDRTNGNGAEETKRRFHESLNRTLTDSLRRSAAIHTVLGGSSSMTHLTLQEGSNGNRNNNNKNGTSPLVLSPISKRKSKTTAKKTSSGKRPMSAQMQALINDPFPQVKHNTKWIGSPSSDRGLTYSSSANHFITNIQEIPRKVPPVPESSIVLEMRQIEKQKRQHKHGGRQNSNKRPTSSVNPRLRPIEQYHDRRPKTAPTAEGKSWALTKKLDSMMGLDTGRSNNSNNSSIDGGEQDGYYNDDFEAAPGVVSMRPKTAPYKSGRQRGGGPSNQARARPKTSGYRDVRGRPLSRRGISRSGSRQRSKSRRGRQRKRGQTAGPRLKKEKNYGRIKHTNAWVGSPSTFRHLSYSSTSNRTIHNVQSIPRQVPRIPGERDDDNIVFPETSLLLSQPSDVTSLPSQIDAISVKKPNYVVATNPHSQRTGGGYIVGLNNGNEDSTDRVEQDTSAVQQQQQQQQQNKKKKNEKWLGSPSSKLPFTFSRTANKHFTQLQMWPQYDATLDPGCSYTKSKLFQKFQRGYEAAEHEEKTKKIVQRHQEMRTKQKGAFSAAVAMTEHELPNEVDDHIATLFQQITSKLYSCWKNQRGQMMHYPSICHGLSSKHGFLNQDDVYSSLLAVGVELTPSEYEMLLRVLLPTNKKGQYSTQKIVDLIMSGRTLLAEEDGEEGGGEAVRPTSPHQGLVVNV